MGLASLRGGVCSAKLWTLGFNRAVEIINKYDIEGNAYADDCSAVLSGPRGDYVIKKLQRMLDELTAWGKTCGLVFNPTKTAVVHFSRKRKVCT